MWLFHVTVTGESLWPALTPGQTYWASSLLPIHAGLIVVACTPHRLVVKVVDRIDKTSITLRGANDQSTPIVVSRSAILGRLLWPWATAGTRPR